MSKTPNHRHERWTWIDTLTLVMAAGAVGLLIWGVLSHE